MTRTRPTSTLFPYTTLFRSYFWRAGAPITSPVRLSPWMAVIRPPPRSEEHTSEIQSHHDLVCRLPLEKTQVRQWRNRWELSALHALSDASRLLRLVISRR